MAGVVERIGDDLLLRGRSALVNLAVMNWDGTTVLAAREFHYGDDRDAVAAQRTAAWETWLAGHTG